MTEPFVRPDVRAFLDLLAAHPRPAFTNDTIAELRPLAAPGMAMLEPPVGELAVMRDLVIPGPACDLPARLFDARAEREPGPVVVFFHGGGFVIGDVDTHASMAAEIARGLDLPVVSVWYRLAPENPWPAAPDDAEAAARWVAANGAALGREITGLVTCGDSAGGDLAVVTAMALRDVPAAAPVVLQVGLYPSVDPDGDYPSRQQFSDGYGLDSVSMAWYRASYAADPTHWRTAPVLHDQTGMPPTLIATASLDPLRDSGRAYAAKCIAVGVRTTYVEMEGTIHGFAGYRRLVPSAQTDLARVLTLAKAMLADTASAAGSEAV